MTSLARRLNVQLGSDETDLLSGLWAAMTEREDWLLVFDNAEDVELVREVLPPLTSIRVLITSQSPAWAALGPTVRVDPFGLPVAARFLLTRSGRRDPRAAATLADMLGNLPLGSGCRYSVGSKPFSSTVQARTHGWVLIQHKAARYPRV